MDAILCDRYLNIYAKVYNPQDSGDYILSLQYFTYIYIYMYIGTFISAGLILTFIKLQTQDAISWERIRGQRRGRGAARKRQPADRMQLKDDDSNEDDLRIAVEVEIANNRARYHDLNCPDRLRGPRKGGSSSRNLYRRSNIPKSEHDLFI